MNIEPTTEDRETAEAEMRLSTAKGQLGRMTDMVRDLADVKKAMGLAVEMFDLEWPKFMESSKKALEDTRLWRMAQCRELRETAAVLEDVGRILKRSDLVNDSMKLKDLVETLERLKALHDSGFLEKALKGLDYERKQGN